MILSSLVQLAQQENLLDDLHRQSQPVHWIIRINHEGKVLAVLEHTKEKTVNGKTKQVHGNLYIPKRKGRAGKVIRPDLLIDKSDYLLGFNAKHKPSAKLSPAMIKDAKWLEECFAACLEETQTIADETQSNAVTAQVKAMQWIHHNLADFAKIWCGVSDKTQPAFHAHQGWVEVPKSWKNNHLFSFQLDNFHVCSYPEVDQHLKTKQAASLAGDDDAVTGRCLVTGEFGPLAKLHDQINLPGDTGPLPIISFNLKAFEHYGMSNNENAQIGKRASIAFNVALKRLLGEGNFDQLPKRHFKISLKTTAVFWSEHAGTELDAADELFPDEVFYSESEASIDDLLEALARPRGKGKPAPLQDTSKIFTLTLTREKSRAILRNATLTTAQEVAASLKAYFQELEISPALTKDPDKAYRSIFNLSWAIEKPESNTGKDQENLNACLFECAIDRKKLYPAAMLARVLERIRAQDKEGPSRRRMALIKAILIRNYKKEYLKMSHSEKDTTAYALGRLFAVLERVQYVATQAKAGIVQRYLGAACTTPAMVFPRLLKLSSHHLHKVGEGFEAKYKNIIDDIFGAIPDKAFPKTLPLEEQGEFMFGYHQQRNLFALEDRERKENKKETASTEEATEVTP